MKQHASNHILGADTIRALATLGVFACHLFAVEPTLKDNSSPVMRVLMAGYMGVPAFFVLSGFLLSIPFWKAHHAGTGMPNLKSYACRRLTRIMPEYFVCVIIMSLITGALTSKWGLIQVAGCLTFTSMLLPPTFTPKWNPPLWSINIEMGFYLMLPLVAACLFHFRSRIRARACVVAIMGIIALGQLLFLWAAPWLEQAVGNVSVFSAASSSTTKNAVALFPHFLIGVITADLYLSQPPGRTDRWCNRYDVLALAAFALIVGSFASATLLPGLVYMQFRWPTFSILIGLLIVSLPRTAVIKPWIDGRIIRTTATLSYGIYIWHTPILFGLKRIWPVTPDGRISMVAVYSLTALACSFTAAAISYRLIGRPALIWMRSREITGAKTGAESKRVASDRGYKAVA